jgi:hypothetical protein
MAHLGDGGRPSWRPVIGVVLPPLWHQGHKGQPMPRTPGPRQRPQAPVAAPTGSARGPEAYPWGGLGRSAPARWGGHHGGVGARVVGGLA